MINICTDYQGWCRNLYLSLTSTVVEIRGRYTLSGYISLIEMRNNDENHFRMLSFETEEECEKYLQDIIESYSNINLKELFEACQFNKKDVEMGKPDEVKEIEQ
jgi:hypothetical protein